MDIVIFAIIAVALTYRLISVLGKEDEPISQHASNPTPDRPQVKKIDKVDLLLRRYNIPLFLKPVFAEIFLKDPSFDIKEFLNGAEAAYNMIIKAVYSQTLNTLSEFVDERVVPKLTTDVHSEKLRVKVHELLIVNANFSNPNATLTVQIKSEVLVNKELVKRTEDWAFTKNLESNSPTWVLTNVIPIQVS